MEYVIIWDEFGGSHRIEQDSLLYKEALESERQSNGQTKLIWPLSKITTGLGWGWWSVYKKLDEFEKDLAQMVPNPGEYRLLKLEGEYTPVELSDMLQHFGSYLANLHYMEAMIEAQCHGLKEGFKTGLQVAMASSESEAKTVAAREGEVLANNELLKENRRNQINQEACLILIKGWREAYEIAWQTVSRIITLRQSELVLQTGRYA